MKRMPPGPPVWTRWKASPSRVNADIDLLTLTSSVAVPAAASVWLCSAMSSHSNTPLPTKLSRQPENWLRNQVLRSRFSATRWVRLDDWNMPGFKGASPPTVTIATRFVDEFPIRDTSIIVAPDTLPEITSLSATLPAKFASSTMTPPPVKSPATFTVRATPSARLSEPRTARFSIPSATPLTATLAPAPIDTVSNPDSTDTVPTAPDPKVSPSLPSPPESAPLTLPPPTCSVSVPLPSETVPVTDAPPATDTVAAPGPSMMARRPFAPTSAPLRREIPTDLRRLVSVLIAASPAPAPPRTDPETAMVMLPGPPARSLVVRARIPLRPPDTSAADIHTSPPAETPRAAARMPSPLSPATVPVAVIDTDPPPDPVAARPPPTPRMLLPPAACVNRIPPVPPWESSTAAPGKYVRISSELAAFTTRFAVPDPASLWASPMLPLHPKVPVGASTQEFAFRT